MRFGVGGPGVSLFAMWWVAVEVAEGDHCADPESALVLTG